MKEMEKEENKIEFEEFVEDGVELVDDDVEICVEFSLDDFFTRIHLGTRLVANTACGYKNWDFKIMVSRKKCEAEACDSIRKSSSYDAMKKVRVIIKLMIVSQLGFMATRRGKERRR
mmetsp:Transcript_23120/g.28382  ORF Transcript_23120/g.28382 Transcript_23120/m.28382 type:complete len:117 (+) Transcript_23120:259-609(+)